jgi:putative solute:sodium symporter small subunit
MNAQPVPTALTRKQRRYWRKNVRLTLALLAVWFVVTFVTGWYAAALNEYQILGFPLGFYTFAQGGPLVFLAIIYIYVKAMNRLDRSYGVDERP